MNRFRLSLAGIIILMPWIFYSSSVSTVELSPPIIQTAPDLSWEKDIQPLLESLICVKFTKFWEKDSITLEFTRECKKGVLLALSPAQEKIAAAFLDVRRVLIPLTSSLVTPPGAPSKYSQTFFMEFPPYYSGFAIQSLDKKNKVYKREDAPLFKKIYCERFFSNPLVLRVLMPAVHAALQSEGIKCPDCPGPETKPARRDITRQELMPYVLAHFQPSSPTDGKGGFAREIVDINTLPFDDPAFDPDLTIASFILLKGNINIDKPYTNILQEAINRIKKEMKDKPEEEKIDFLRTYLAEKLPDSREFKKALFSQVNLLSMIRLNCNNCSPYF